MEKVAKCTAVCGFVGDAAQLCSWDIPYKYLHVTRWLAMDILRDIPNSKVNWVCHFVAEKGKLCFVR